MDRIKKLETLNKLLEKNQLEPYIRHIRFPKYKNLQPYSRIDFGFPLTVIVGSNGTNKSSIIKALAGAPHGKSPGGYLFSTNLDNIPVSESPTEQARIIYGYYLDHEKETVEVRKARVSKFADPKKKTYDPDYWEPTRPYKEDDMKPMQGEIKNEYRGKTRWNQIKKEVVYIDFRSELSAFDKCFYFIDINKKMHKSSSLTRFDKRKPIKDGAKKLAEVIKNRRTTYKYREKREQVFELYDLSSEELGIISRILGRSYEQITIIEHSFFSPSTSYQFIPSGYSVYIQHNKDLHYSEAFAGSGEFSVVMLVVKILRAPKKSLILLDEPEVSIHPEAQYRLIDFLLDQIIQNKHQIVISTHSPSLIRSLPSSAIKVLHFSEAIGQTFIKQNILPEEAFYHIGEPIPDKIQIVVEDELARRLILKANGSLESSFKNLFDVVAFSGGAEAIKLYFISAQVNLDTTNVFIFLDGDQEQYSKEISKFDLKSNYSFELLQDCIRDFAKNTKIFGDKIDFLKKYVEWVQSYVFYLPCDTPEEFIKTNIMSDEKYNEINMITDAKKWFEELAIQSYPCEPHEITAQQILYLQLILLNTIPYDNEKLTTLREQLVRIANTHSQSARPRSLS